MATDQFAFRVFVTGESRRSVQTITNLRALCEGRIPGAYHIEVIDVLSEPGAVEQNQVLATPMVIRVSPGQPRRVVGDLSDLAAAGQALGLPVGDAAAS